MDLYRYVFNNTLNRFDPYGEDSNAGGYVALAATLALADGPLPIGDIAATGLLIYGGYCWLTNHDSDHSDDEYDDDNDVPEKHPLKNREERNKERSERPKNPQEKEKRQRDNEEKKRRSGGGGSNSHEDMDY